MSLEETSYTPAGRFFMEIAYDGSEYSGWQIQPHSPSVQQVIQEELTKLYDKQHIHLIGSSRTDAGVHAQRFAASFLYPERPAIPLEQLFKALNRRLPPSIRIRSLKPVPLEFHSRYDALGKAYTYVLNLGDETPFSCRYSWKSIHKLDADRIAGKTLVRTPEDGDRFTPLGMRGTKLLSDYLTDRKVPRFERAVPVVCDEEGILFVAGFTIDERMRVRPDTTHILHYHYEED